MECEKFRSDGTVSTAACVLYYRNVSIIAVMNDWCFHTTIQKIFIAQLEISCPESKDPGKDIVLINQLSLGL